MRKIIVSTYATLNGVIENPQDWSFDYFDEEAAKFARDQLFAADALLLGRETYEGFARRGHPGQTRLPTASTAWLSTWSPRP